MLYELCGEALVLTSLEEYSSKKDRLWLAVFTMDELEKSYCALDVNQVVVEEIHRENPANFESFDGFDYMVVGIPDDKNLLRTPKQVRILFRKDLLLFACKDLEVQKALEKAFTLEKFKSGTLAHILYTFFEKLTSNDTLVLDKIDHQISALEEALITSKKQDCIPDIIRLRKKLMALKRYYEQLLIVTETLLENENGLVTSKAMRYFKILSNRVNRLYSYTLSLREGVTQVREAYQAQVDINLNQIMKLFTVITTIFLPLTLIVGWYGMNLQMPEFYWHFGYPFVIAMSVTVVVVCLVFFKKNKWF